MKTLLMIITLVFVCCFIVGCQQGEEVAAVDVEADIQAIKDAVAGLNDAVNAIDIERIMSFFADDAVEIRPNEPASTGKEAIKSRSQRMFDEATFQEKDVVEDVKVSGNLAVAHVTWSASGTRKTDGTPFEVNGNWIMVFEKQSDDTWKIIYSIWSDEGLVRPTQAE